MDQSTTHERRDSGSHDITSPGKLLYDTRGNVETVRAGTLGALVENLTRHDKVDGPFNRIFLTTYKYFTSGTELMGLLIERFDYPSTKWNFTQAAELPVRVESLIRTRVIYVLMQWLDNYWSEPQGHATERNLRTLLSFAKRATASTETTATQPLLALVQRRLAGLDCKRRSLPSISTPPKPILPRKLDKLQFIKIDAKEIARQLTIMEAHMLGKVQPNELLNKNWQRRQSSELAPNVRALIRYSNQLSNWVCALILAESDLKKRTQVIGHLVLVATVRSLI